MSFSVSEEPERVLHCRKIWNEVESQLFEKLTAKPIKKREGEFMLGKLKMWKECIKTKYCSSTALLYIYSVYKQSENFHPQVYFEEYK